MSISRSASPFFRRLTVAALAAILAFGLGLGPALARKKPRRRTDPRAELRFAAEMARQGLWREALFRWEKVARIRPDDGRIWNNIAVAREALGDRDGAREAYDRALELGPEQNIAANRALFLRRGKQQTGPGGKAP
ncbi:MAG: tetratricopeptide repeat protein [Acidobacteriota bacterium]|nr:tetratricopeptide repeat protein [Acidobacteriota bacterium]MDQ7088745.1 tetratricopeptide repeat protein [Acidobacteriota bacterium]